VNNKIYKYHQYANLFPLLEGEDYNNLKEDIKKNGLLEPIYLYKDEICDGRNRYRCCIDLGIKPRTTSFKFNCIYRYSFSKRCCCGS